MGPRGRGRPRGRKPGRGASLAPRDARVRPPSLHECFLTRCGDILDRLQKKDTLNIFLEPVDNDIAPDYDVIVQRKMDFSTVRTKLEAGEYEDDLRAFHSDLSLIWSNCLLYNGAELDNVFSKKAVELRKLVDGRLVPSTAASLENDKRVLDQWTERHRRKPHASPTSSAREGNLPSMPGAAGLGPSVAEGDSILPSVQVSVDTGISAEDAERQAREQARESAAAARRVALRSQYLNGGLYIPPPAAGKEPVFYVDADTPAFRPSMVRYTLQAKGDDDALVCTGIGLGTTPEMRGMRSHARPGLSQNEPVRAPHQLRQRPSCDWLLLQPIHLIAPTAVIPKRRLELPDAAYRTLGTKQRQNPCRPISTVSSIKVKDYVQSLQSFVQGAGTIATKIIGELLSPEIAILREEEKRKQRKREAAAMAAGNGSSEGQRPSKLSAVEYKNEPRPGDVSHGLSGLPKLAKRIDELDGYKGLERIIGPELANEVRCLPVDAIDFSMPYGLSPKEMAALAQFAGTTPGSPNQPPLNFLLRMNADTDSHARGLTRGGNGRVVNSRGVPSNSAGAPQGSPRMSLRGPTAPAVNPPYGHHTGGPTVGPGPLPRNPPGMPSSAVARQVPGQASAGGGMTAVRAASPTSTGGSNPESLMQVQAEDFRLRSSREEQQRAFAVAEAREREIRNAARRTQTTRTAAYSQATAAAGNIPMASPVGAMHDAACLNTPIPPAMVKRVTEVQDSYRAHAKDAHDVAASAVESAVVVPLASEGTSSMDVPSNSQRESSIGSAGPGSSSSNHLSPADENTMCDNCHTKDTPGWRQGPGKGDRLCNACGLYFVKHRHMRPVGLRTKRRGSTGSIRSTGSGSGSVGGGGSASRRSGRASQGRMSQGSVGGPSGPPNAVQRTNGLTPPRRGMPLGGHHVPGVHGSNMSVVRGQGHAAQQQAHPLQHLQQDGAALQQPLAPIASLQIPSQAISQMKNDPQLERRGSTLDQLVHSGDETRNFGQPAVREGAALPDGGDGIFPSQSRHPRPPQRQGMQLQSELGGDSSDAKLGTLPVDQPDPASAMQAHIPSVQDLLQAPGRAGSGGAALPNIQSLAGSSGPTYRPMSNLGNAGVGDLGGGNGQGGDLRMGSDPSANNGGMGMFVPAGGMDLGGGVTGPKQDDPMRQMNVSELVSADGRGLDQSLIDSRPGPLMDGQNGSQHDPDLGGDLGPDQQMVQSLFGVPGEGGHGGDLGSGGGEFGF